MKNRGFFHKIKVCFQRMCESSISYTPEYKRYGNQGEDNLAGCIQALLPDCKIKKNIIIQSEKGNAEIDCLVLFKNKLFAIEVKHWKGQITEQENEYVQHKQDRWTGEIYTKHHISPFKQLRRATYLLREQIPGNVWINPIVFFEDADSVKIHIDDVWFNDINNLVSYIMNNGEPSYGNADLFFYKCIAADCLHSYSWNNILHCVISDESLRFKTSAGMISRKEIKSITITHHWTYDKMRILTVTNKAYIYEAENASIYVVENGHRQKYALCKLDYIQLGDK